jgi:hypothetical protein
LRVFIALKNLLISDRFFVIYFGLLGLMSIGITISSLKWIIGLDLQPVLSAAYLTDKFHYLPYKDFIYLNFPGVHFYYYFIVKLFGYSYIGIRIADIIYLLITLTASFFLFKKVSLKVAVSSIVIFSLIYFAGQEYYSLQRDYVLLLPIILAILLTTTYPNRMANTKSFLLGFLCAIAALIKPQAVIALPVIFTFNMLYNSENASKILSQRRIIKQLLCAASGFLIPILCTIVFLTTTGSFDSFWDILMNFMPFYRNSKTAIVSDPSMPVENIFSRYQKFGGYRPFLLTAVIGFYISIFRSNLNRHQRLLIYLFGSLSAVFIIYVVIGGKVMTYYWIPFAYCIIFLSSTCFIEQKEYPHRYSALLVLIPLFIIIATIAIQICRPPNGKFFMDMLNETHKNNLIYSDILKASEYLKNNLKPGDKVTSLDDVGIGMHSMLLADAEPATYYVMYEQMLAFGEIEFPKSEYLHRLHNDYMERFNIAKPRFVLDFAGGKCFNDLRTILDSNYVPIKLEHAIIYERKTDE